MTDEDKLEKMFTEVHGEMTGSCSIEVYYTEDTYEPDGINVIKDGDLCWSKTKTDILFDYITKEW